MNFDEKYLKSYISVIQEMETIEEIESALPSRETKNYYEFIRELIQRFMEIRQTLCALLEDVTDNLDQKYVEKELEKNELHLTVLNHCLEEEKIFITDERKRNIIFLKTASDGISFFEKDLKAFPKEYLPSIMNLYEKLKQDFHSENEPLFKRLIGDDRVKGLYELKDFKIRLVFHILSDNTAVVIAAYLKKSNVTPKIVREMLESRNAYFEKNKELLENLLASLETKESLM